MSERDDSNPMHDIGHGRGDDVQSPTVPGARQSSQGHRKTAMYSFINPDKVVNVGEEKVEPTQPMAAVDTPLTVKDVISRLIEINSAAWTCLPQSMKDGLIDRPKDFQFVDVFTGSSPTTPKILYNGVLLRFNRSAWEVEKIIR